MNCVDLQYSLGEIEDGSGAEQQAHLRACPACSALVAELSRIASSAVQLRAADEPSPRVWNSIEIALRQEGLIRPPRPQRALVPSFAARWGIARWLVPVAAALLVTVGIYVRQNSRPVRVAQTIAPSPVSDLAITGLNDDDLLQEVSNQTPRMQAEYSEDLRRANEYIQDAESEVKANPHDEEARRSLQEAYQQKAMLFEMAMDRSLP